jgi:glycosyltransferase involved in cell wall biosynthesis
MKILVISNFYPPHYIGGYELGCRDVVEALKARGYEVRVLTSTYGVGQPECDGEIYRWLEARIHWKGPRWVQRVKVFKMEVNNQNALRRLCQIYTPDVVYLWNLGLVSVSLALLAQRWGFRQCYFVSDDWLSRWESDSWYSLWRNSPSWGVRFGRTLLRPLLTPFGIIPVGSLDLRHVQFASQHLKHAAVQAGKPADHAEVIHWGVDVQRFSYKRTCNNPKRLLYVGQIVPYKGVHVAIAAMNALVRKHGIVSAQLTLAGGSQRPDYLLEMQRLVESYGLGDHVHFTGLLPRELLPQVYHEHDILVFPSIWDEPFSITLLEAMSSGLAVVSTGTGGTQEVLGDNVNALIFPKEDAEACASQILRLFSDQELFDKVRRNGRRTVEEKFRFESMMDSIERSLLEAAH